jgi:hypothetical protein
MFASPRLPRSILRVATLAVVAAFAGIVGADEIPPGVGQYADAYATLQKSKGRQSIEPVFEAGLQTTSHLQAVLPTLSESDYQNVQRQMLGFIVVRRPDENPVVRPSVDYFRALAKKKGTKADRDFFDIYAKTEPDGNGPFPAYVKQLGHLESGCTDFAGKKITDLYRGWLTFRTAYPDAYAAEAQGEIDSIETELQSGICSCNDADQTAAGLQTFVNAFPSVPITPKVKARLDSIRANKSSFRFECQS